MIEINLLPEEFKPKVEKFKVDPAYLLLLIPLIFSLLIVWHIALGMIGVMKGQQMLLLQSKLKKLQPQVAQIRNLEKEQGLTPADVQFISGALAKRIVWGEKLHMLSWSLPDGIWFNGLSVTPREMVIKASVISLQKEEISLINKFMKILRQDKNFIKDFSDLQLGTTQRKQIGGFEIVDFTLTGILKESGQKPKK